VKNGLKTMLQLSLRSGLAFCPGKILVIVNGPAVEIGGFFEQLDVLSVLGRYIVTRHIFILSNCRRSLPVFCSGDPAV
jgi:hypothetical protein